MADSRGGFFQEPKDVPGIAIVQNEQAPTSDGGTVSQQIWLHVNDGTEQGIESVSDVAVVTTTWLAFSSLTTAVILNVAKFAMVMGALPFHIYMAFTIVYVVLFGLWCYFGGRYTKEHFWLRLSAVVAGFLLVAL